jgi:uncharacterized coiled-coil DUF342 family protein
MAQLSSDIENLESKIADSKQRRDGLERESRNLGRQRDELNEKFRKFKEEIRSLKEKRDTINQQVRDLKELREQARRRVMEVRDEIEDTKKRVEELRNKAEGGYVVLKKRLDGLEWKIQTSSLSTKEESRMIGQMKGLASQLEVHEKIRKLRDRVIILQAELGANRLKATESHEQMSILAQESETYHQRMMEIVGQASDLKESADRTHVAFIESRQKADVEHIEYVRARSIREKIVFEAQAKRVKKEQELKQKVEVSAEDKLKRKEKLSLEEFRALVEKGAI